jgi:hypothetical protein
MELCWEQVYEREIKMKTDFSQKQIDEQIRLLTKSIKQLESQKKYLQKLKADKKIYPVNPEEGD